MLAARRRASQILRRLGVPVGEIFIPTSPSEARRRASDAETPTVVWQCTYAESSAGRRAQLLVEADAEFAAVRAHMATINARFEHDVYELDDAPLE